MKTICGKIVDMLDDSVMNLSQHEYLDTLKEIRDEI